MPNNLRNDRPVDSSTPNIIWDDNDPIIVDINDIVRQIAETFQEEQHIPSRTFAIYGPWGSGKSSLLYIIEDKLCTLAGDTVTNPKKPSTHRNAMNRLSFARYDAAIEEVQYSQRNIPIPVSLTLRIAMGFAGTDDPEDAVDSLGQLFSNIRDHIERKREAAGSMSLAEELVFWGQELAKLPDIESKIEKLMRNNRATMVVFIDDLDRCSPKFVWDLLRTCQRWSKVENLFFVIAVDQDILYNAVKREAGQHHDWQTPAVILEKYIQRAVYVPSIEDRLASVVNKLLSDADTIIPENYLSPEEKRALPIVLKVLRGEATADFIRYGIARITPRSIKRAISQALSSLISAAWTISANGTEEEQERVVYREFKRILIAERWPTFYRTLFIPGVIKQDPEYANVFSQIQQHAVSAVQGETGQRYDLDYFKFRVNRTLKTSALGNYESLFSDSDDKALMSLLGTPPTFVDLGQSAIAATSTTQKEEVTEAVEIPDGTDPEQLIFQLYYASETADKSGQRDEVLRLSRQILAVAKQYRQRLRASVTPTIGNAAINAENNRDFELAYGLYDVSYQLDPTHANNMQNYADFIIQKDQRQLFELAETLLGRLENEFVAYRPERTMRLRVLFNRKLGRSTELTQQQIDTIYDAFMQNPADQRRFASTMQLYQSVGRFDYVRRVGKKHFETTETEQQRYVALRGYADTMAASNDKSDEFTAMQIYFCMLIGDIWYPIDSVGDYVDVRHNFAVLLYKHDWDKTAGDLWFDAQRVKPQDPQIRRAYAMYLAQAAKRADLAQKVASGIALDEGDKPEGTTDKQPLPPKFIDGGCQDPFGIQDPPADDGSKPGGFDFGSLFKGYGGGTPPGNN